MPVVRIVEYLAAMALTRDFRETVRVRAERDPRFREALFTEALNSYLAGDTAAGKAILRDLVNATIGFESLALAVKKPSKSLHRMLAPRGNPSTYPSERNQLRTNHLHPSLPIAHVIE